MQPGAVLVDIAIDQGGCFEGSHPTTHAEPTYRGARRPSSTASPSMPGAVARQRSAPGAHQRHPALRAEDRRPRLPGGGPGRRSRHSRSGPNATGGRLVNEGVARRPRARAAGRALIVDEVIPGVTGAIVTGRPARVPRDDAARDVDRVETVGLRGTAWHCALRPPTWHMHGMSRSDRAAPSPSTLRQRRRAGCAGAVEHAPAPPRRASRTSRKVGTGRRHAARRAWWSASRLQWASKRGRFVPGLAHSRIPGVPKAAGSRR